MNDDSPNDDSSADSISGRSAALYFAEDSSLANLLLCHGIKIRDFILISFLSDQGPLSVDQLSRIVNIDLSELTKSIMRLSAAGLIMRDSGALDPQSTTARLTSRGQDIAARIDNQL